MRRFLSLLLLIIFVFSFTACDNGEGPETDGPVKEQPKEMVVVVNNFSNTLDAMVAESNNVFMIQENTMNALVKYNGDYEIVTDMAESWERVDSVTWVFTINEGFKFQNGDDVKISDIIFSIERLREVPQAMRFVAMIEKAEEVDGKLRIVTVAPDSALLDKLTSIGIQSEKHVTEIGENFGDTMMGTGPYKVTSFVKGSEVVIETWDGYPFEKPAIEKITFKAITEDASRYIALETGDAHVALALRGDDINRLKENKNLNYDESLLVGAGFFNFNVNKEPFNNILVRRALAHAVNRPGIIEAVIKGEPTESLIPPMIEGSTQEFKYPEYDLEKAKALLVEAGYPDGFEFEAVSFNPMLGMILQIVQADFVEIGVNMSIKNVEFGVFLETIIDGTFTIALGDFTGKNTNLISNLEQYKTFAPGNNISGYSNPEVDRLIEEAQTTLDKDVMIANAIEVQRIVAEDIPTLPMNYPVGVTGISKDLDGLEVLPTGRIRFYDVTFK